MPAASAATEEGRRPTHPRSRDDDDDGARGTKRPRAEHAAPPPVALVAHASSPLDDSSGRARVFTAQLALPVDAADVAAVERVAVANAKRPKSEGEPPLYSWVRMGKTTKPCWRQPGCAAAGAVSRLLALCNAAAQDGARALGVQLRPQPCISAIVNVWQPGCRAQAHHDDGQGVLTVLLRLRAVPGCGEVQFQDGSRDDVWHTALGAHDTLLVFGPHV